MESQVVFVPANPANPVGNVPASGFYFNDSFTGAGVLNANWVASNQVGSGQAVLTARSDESKPTGGIAGIGAGADAVGAGALRLTSSEANQATFVLYDQAFDASKGVNITFDLFAYGGIPFAPGEQPGDGLAFFLIDGATPGANVTPGGFGAALGYAKKINETVPLAGITNGYLGIGFDEFGSFGNPTEVGDGPGRKIDSIGVRGAGNGTAETDYTYLGGTESLTTAGGIDSPGVTIRAGAKRTIEIDVDAAGKIDISIDLNADGDFDDESERYFDIATADGTRPSTYKFGFSASTGASTNIHEVRNLAIAPSKTVGSPTPNSVSFGGFGAGLTYVENAAPGVITTGLAIEGPATGISSATVKIANNFSVTQDRLTIGNSTANSGTTTSGLNWSYDPATGTLTLTGTGATAQAYQEALRQVTYSNSSDAPTTGDRTIRYSLLSGTGATATTITSRDALVKINAVDDLPTTINLSSTGVPTGQAGAIVGNINVVDPDGPGDAGSYTFNVTGGSDKFEIVGNATSGFQLKLKPGQVVGAGEVIPALTVNGTDDGAGPFTRNFNLTPGQPKSELFWRNPNGQEVFWQMQNSSELVGAVNISNESPYDPSWRLAAVVDMDNDGIKDHVYQKGADVRYLLLNQTGGQTSGVKSGGAVTPTFANAKFGGLNGQAAAALGDFRLVGVENVSGSAQADLIFYSPTVDRLVYWTTNGSQIVDSGFFTSAASPNGQGTSQINTWSVQAMGDFTGDGRADILWRNNAGQIVVWGLNGTVVDLTKVRLVGTVTAGTELRGVGDFNGDGVQDVVWRDRAANVTSFWNFNNSTATGVAPAATKLTDNGNFSTSDFQIEAIADLDGDGKSDLVWRNVPQSFAVVWNLNLPAVSTANPSAASTFQLSSIKSVTTVRNFIGANPSRQTFINADKQWDIDGANGIAPVAAPV